MCKRWKGKKKACKVCKSCRSQKILQTLQLQKSASIQPRTDLPKFGQPTANPRPPLPSPSAGANKLLCPRQEEHLHRNDTKCLECFTTLEERGRVMQHAKVETPQSIRADLEKTAPTAKTWDRNDPNSGLAGPNHTRNLSGLVLLYRSRYFASK